MKKIEITKNEMASIIGGAQKTWYSTMNHEEVKDKVNRHGKIKRIKVTVNYTLSAPSENNDWNSSNWEYESEQGEAEFLSNPELQYLGSEPEDQF